MDLSSLVIATKKLSNVKEIEKLIISAAKEHEAEIIKLNTSQLEQGLLSDGEKTEEYASIDYTNYKSSKGSKSVPNKDLKLTGKFYAGWKVKFKTTKFNMFSTDSKAKDLENKNTSDIYGLTDKNKGLTGKKIKPNLLTLLKNALTK